MRYISPTFLSIVVTFAIVIGGAAEILMIPMLGVTHTYLTKFDKYLDGKLLLTDLNH